MANWKEIYKPIEGSNVVVCRGGPQDGLWMHFDKIPETLVVDGHVYWLAFDCWRWVDNEGNEWKDGQSHYKTARIFAGDTVFDEWDDFETVYVYLGKD